MAVKQWTQPDGKHFRGLCANEFWPVAGVNGAGGCNICVSPLKRTTSLCLCSPDIGIYPQLYIRLQKIGNWNECWHSDVIGDFTVNSLTGTDCSYQSTEKANAYIIQLNQCFASGALPPFGAGNNYPNQQVPVFPRFSINGAAWFNQNAGIAQIIVNFFLYTPGPNQTWRLNYSAFSGDSPRLRFQGLLPWCANRRGVVDLIQLDTSQFVPAQFQGKISTHPFS
jgi:hypothetical protein